MPSLAEDELTEAAPCGERSAADAICCVPTRLGCFGNSFFLCFRTVCVLIALLFQSAF